MCTEGRGRRWGRGGIPPRPQRGSGFLREVEVVERAFAGSAELDGVDVGRRRLGAEGVEALPGGLGTVEGAGVGDATRGDVAVVRHLAAAGDGEVVQEVPLVAEGGEGGELGVVVEAEVAEEGADRRGRGRRSRSFARCGCCRFCGRGGSG